MSNNINTTQELLKALKSIECPDSTFVPSISPLVISKAKYSEIWGVDGKQYIDFFAGFGSLPLGHNPDCLKNIWENLISNELCIQGFGDLYASHSKIKFMELIHSILPPDLSKISLACSGSQAVEIALKTAKLVTGKSGFISFKSAYHGLDCGVLGLAGHEKFKTPFEGLYNSKQFIQCNFNSDLQEIIDASSELNNRGFPLAAIIVEPIQGRGGIVAANQEWLTQLRTLCSELNALFIVDEIWTGLGRAGEVLLSDSLKPDLVCIGKSLGGGMPISACVGTENTLGSWQNSQGEALHTGTFFGHALACEVGFHTLKYILDNDIWQNAQTKAQNFLTDLTTNLSHHHKIVDIRGFGFLIGIEFKEELAAVKVCDSLRSIGILALPAGEKGNILSLTPALNISDSLLQKFTEKITSIV